MLKVNCYNELKGKWIMSKKRNSTIELLRIISLFLIILGHFDYHSRWDFDPSQFNVIESSVHTLWIGGKLGVNLFVLISSYFLIKSEFKLKSLVNTWLTSYFYALIIFIISILFKIIKFNVKDLIKIIFLTSSGYINWFVTAYIIMYLLSPFMNVILNNLSRRQFNKLIIILLIFFSLSKMVFNNPSIGTNGNDAVWLLVVYCCGSYIRIFENQISDELKNTYIWLIFTVSTLISIISVFLLDYISVLFKLHNEEYVYERFISGYSLFQLISAICLFIIFLRMKSFYNSMVNKIASTTFAIYLIHDNLLISDWLWNSLVKGYRFEDTPLVLIYGVLIAGLIFIVCSIIDLVRQYIFNGLQKKIVEYIVKLKIFSYFIDE